MRFLADTADLAQMISAFVSKGGWIAAPLGGALLLYLLQDKLVFNPVREEAPMPPVPPTHKMRPIMLTMRDGVRLHGWWMRAAGPASILRPAVIYFGGRSEDVCWAAGSLPVLEGTHALFINYRGYGRSQGTPTEASLLDDALTLYDWLALQPGVDAGRIGVIGRSLGSGVATYLASQRSPAAVVLLTPYDSIVEIARMRFPFCAARWLLKHRFESVRFAQQSRSPALVLLAEADTIVPLPNAMRLIGAWRGPVDVQTIAGSDHCDIQLKTDTWRAIHSYLSERMHEVAHPRQADDDRDIASTVFDAATASA
jgi:fermentation-respiration switch protein FrsA (DUF1100 family)